MEKEVYEVWLNGSKIVLEKPQDFYDAVDFLHTAALDVLPDTTLAPVKEALTKAMDHLLLIDEVRG